MRCKKSVLEKLMNGRKFAIESEEDLPSVGSKVFVKISEDQVMSGTVLEYINTINGSQGASCKVDLGDGSTITTALDRVFVEDPSKNKEENSEEPSEEGETGQEALEGEVAMSEIIDEIKEEIEEVAEELEEASGVDAETEEEISEDIAELEDELEEAESGEGEATVEDLEEVKEELEDIKEELEEALAEVEAGDTEVAEEVVEALEEGEEPAAEVTDEVIEEAVAELTEVIDELVEEIAAVEEEIAAIAEDAGEEVKEEATESYKMRSVVKGIQKFRKNYRVVARTKQSKRAKALAAIKLRKLVKKFAARRKELRKGSAVYRLLVSLNNPKRKSKLFRRLRAIKHRAVVSKVF